jgi:signal transduction histidine kinase
VKLESYSSLAAFLAHWRTLARADALDKQDRERLSAMREILTTLRPEELAALEEAAVTGATARHRERAELSLARALRSRGLLAP